MLTFKTIDLPDKCPDIFIENQDFIRKFIVEDSPRIRESITKLLVRKDSFPNNRYTKIKNSILQDETTRWWTVNTDSYGMEISSPTYIYINNIDSKSARIFNSEPIDISVSGIEKNKMIVCRAVAFNERFIPKSLSPTENKVVVYDTVIRLTEIELNQNIRKLRLVMDHELKFYYSPRLEQIGCTYDARDNPCGVFPPEEPPIFPESYLTSEKLISSLNSVKNMIGLLLFNII